MNPTMINEFVSFITSNQFILLFGAPLFLIFLVKVLGKCFDAYTLMKNDLEIERHNERVSMFDNSDTLDNDVNILTPNFVNPDLQDPEDTNHCHYCNTKLFDKDRTCPNCGAPVNK